MRASKNKCMKTKKGRNVYKKVKPQAEKSYFYVYIPENLDLEKILSENPPDFKYYKDNFLYILSLINSIAENLKDNDTLYDWYESTGYVPIYTRILKSKVHNYTEYIKYLICNKIIETDNRYLPAGGKSKAYKYTSIYEVGLKRVQISKKTLLKKVFNRDKNTLNEDDKNNIFDELPLSIIPFLTKWFNEKLTIDIEEVKKYLLALSEEETKIEAKKENTKKNQKDIIEKQKRKYNTRFITADKIYHKDFLNNMVIDRKAGRLHTLLTRLKKELRNYITYDDKTLVSLDIKNSQPFLSLALVDINAFEKSNIENILCLYYTKTMGSIRKADNRIKQIKELLKKYEEEQDLFEYKLAAIQGTLYEKMGIYLTKYRSSLPRNHNNQRDIAKHEFMKVFFGINNNESIKAFSAYFPSVSDIFQCIKKGNYRLISWVLQHFEARIVIWCICESIAEKQPQIPLFTIHDSIVTTEEYADYVQAYMKETIYNIIGKEPHISREIWKP